MMLHDYEIIQQVAHLIMRRVADGSLNSVANVRYLAHEIVRNLDGEHTLWTKWSADRTKLLDRAQNCWIPVEGLQEALNTLPGAALTVTDIEQRLKELWKTTFGNSPREELQEDCLRIYASERAQGTEFTAIVGAIGDFLQEVEHREAHENYERAEARREAARIAEQQRLLSGVDCDWTTLGTSVDLFLRRKGRLFRLTKIEPLEWELSEVPSLDRGEDAKVLGRFRGRGLARTAIYELTRSIQAAEATA